MSALLATANTKIFIGPATAYPNRAMLIGDFPAATANSWTRIIGTTNLGTGAGDASELVTSNQIDSGGDEARTRKVKGSRNAGSMTIVADLDMTDPGQIAVVAAERERGAFAFRVEFNDAPAGGKPSTRHFIALVMSASESYDEANSIMKLNITLELDSNMVRTPAAAGGGA